MLNKENLKANLLQLYKEMEQSPMSKETFAERMAEIIYNFVITAEINNGTGRYNPGTLVAGQYPVISITSPEIINISGGLK